MRNIRHKSNLLLLSVLFVFCITSCAVQKKGNMKKNKVENTSTGKGKYIITTPIVSKNFVKKNGEITNKKEFYVQQSIQDYFIKFCESEIEREDLENCLSNITGEIKTVTVEVELRNGFWDICDENFKSQSRMGEYIIIHRIMEDKQK